MQKYSGRVLAIISYFYDVYLFFLGRNAKMKSHILKNYTRFGRQPANLGSSKRMAIDFNIAELSLWS